MSPSSTPARERVSDLTGRIQRRRRRTMLQRTLRWLAVLLAVAMVAALVWMVWFSSVLDARRVEVRGNKAVPSELITRTAAVTMGVPLVRTDVTGPAQRVAAMERIQSVKVSTSWPHTVVITVTERTPVFVLKQSDGYRQVDAEGHTFGLSPRPAQGLPVATVDDGPKPQLLRDLATVVTNAPDALKKLPLTAKTSASITFHLDAKRSVVWGSADQSEIKKQVLETLMKAVPKATVYDISAPSRPTTR